ncbi:MAG: arylsulfotransferase (ASST) [Planctomycetes bacterium]|nr:arylsulfotransferase (ASST) [Planctomycetota bacterium]
MTTPRIALAILALAVISGSFSAQQPGYTIFGPLGSTVTSMVDTNENLQHTWSSTFIPGVSVYLQPNGNLLRTKRTTTGPGGVGGGIEEITWDGTVVWDWINDIPGMVLHHDLALLPNGNVLAIGWDEHSAAAAVAAGRNPATITGDLTPDRIIEVQKTGPTTGVVVWEWRAFDHLVQDFDPAQANFGVVADHPERIDVNYPPGQALAADWMHSNGLDYIEEFDQVILNVRNFDEFWTIDHSTTTAEAAGSTGGNSGKGGDLLYRWGNPQAYGRGTALDQVFEGQHDANWIQPGFPGHGNIMVFNNFAGANFSSAVELTPPVDGSGNYFLAPGMPYGPTAPVWEYTATPPTDLFSAFVGGAERLRNGNTLITEGATGFMFEVDPSGTTVWSYQNQTGAVFKARRYEHNLWSVGDTVSVSAGGSVDFELLAGPEHANRIYLMLGSRSGTLPGFFFSGFHFPLNPDDYFRFILQNPAGSPLSQPVGMLDANGRATGAFALPPGSPAFLVGLELNHVFLVIDQGVVEFVSNPLPLNLVL